MWRTDRPIVRKKLGILSAALMFVLAAQAQEPLPFPHSLYMLKNGLRVVLAEDFVLPVVTVAVVYNVGSIHEQPGRTGMAYLLENLMFQGSNNVSQMQHIAYINRVGGKLNARTSEDRTLFYQTLPSNQLALALWLESDRMKSLNITASKVQAAKSALLEEIRRRRREIPYLESSFRFDGLLFDDFAYSHPILWSENDIRNITEEDVHNFYQTYYLPNNALLCITGNIDKIKAREIVSRYFESIPKGKDVPPPPPLPKLDRQAVMDTILDPLAPSPGFHLGFPLSSPHPEDISALVILDYLLMRGKSSRLVKRLIKRERLVGQLSGGVERRGGLFSYRISATTNNESIANLAQKAIFSELQRLRSTFVPKSELVKAKRMFQRDFSNRMATSLEKALFLSDLYLVHQPALPYPVTQEKALGVTPTHIVSLVSRYFTPEKAILLNIKIR